MAVGYGKIAASLNADGITGKLGGRSRLDHQQDRRQRPGHEDMLSETGRRNDQGKARERRIILLPSIAAYAIMRCRGTFRVGGARPVLKAAAVASAPYTSQRRQPALALAAHERHHRGAEAPNGRAATPQAGVGLGIAKPNASRPHLPSQPSAVGFPNDTLCEAAVGARPRRQDSPLLDVRRGFREQMGG